MKPEFEQPSLLEQSVLDDLISEVINAKTGPKPRDVITETREFHGWTIDKLEVLDLYLKMYRRVAGGGSYIDAFSGQGEGSHAGHVVNGSAVVAANSGAFAKLHLIEKDPGSHERLRRRIAQLPDKVAAKCEVHPPTDSNLLIPTLLTPEIINPDKACFAFLDPESTQLSWGTVDALANYKTFIPDPDGSPRPKACKVEMWILFNLNQAVRRLWPDNRVKYPETMSARTLDDLMGGRDAWWDLWQDKAPAAHLLGRYVERLRGLGYEYVLQQPIRDPGTGRIQYYMIHATDHPSAFSFMRWSKKQLSRVDATQLPGMDSIEI